MTAFSHPIPTNISIPMDVGEALEERQLPKLSCFHPSTFKGSVEQFERMVSLMIIEFVSSLAIFLRDVDDWDVMAYHFERPLKRFFPHCKVKARQSLLNGVLNVCKFDKNKFVVYEEKDTRRRKRSIVVEFGEPQNVSFVAMVDLRYSLYPNRLSDSFTENDKSLIDRLAYACYVKIVKEDNVRKLKEMTEKPIKKSLSTTLTTISESYLLSRAQKLKSPMLSALKRTPTTMPEEQALGHLTEFALAMSTIDKPTCYAIRELALKMSNLQRTFFTSLLSPPTTASFRRVMDIAVPCSSGSIFAVLSNGVVVRTKRPIILSPPIPNAPDMFIWVEEHKGFIALFEHSAKQTTDTFTF